jgi:uncharacterized membrane protein YGL010W
MMRRVDALFARYGESHRNPVNHAIHWVCVPLITWSVLAALWSASPALAFGGIVPAIAFYAWLSVPLAAGMLAICALMIVPLTLLGPNALAIAAAAFVVAWIGQFVGHAIEGRKPSFLEDVKFLLVGPVWLLHLVYRRAGIPY